MARFLVRSLVLCVFLVPALVYAQGVLINITPGERIPLPRPIIIYPPYPHPHPIPPPIPPSTYKIKELSVNVKLTEQVARTQVTQSFVNTGSRPMGRPASKLRTSARGLGMRGSRPQWSIRWRHAARRPARLVREKPALP